MIVGITDNQVFIFVLVERNKIKKKPPRFGQMVE